MLIIHAFINKIVSTLYVPSRKIKKRTRTEIISKSANPISFVELHNKLIQSFHQIAR